MAALDVFAETALVAGILAVAVLLVSWVPYVRGTTNRLLRHIAMPAFLLLALSVLACFAACWTSQDISHDEVLGDLAELSPDAKVMIQGKVAADPLPVIASLKKLDWLPDHHSSPTTKIPVNITDKNKNLALLMARDSGNPREYWVFYPKHKITTFNEIGKIRTDLFDSYR